VSYADLHIHSDWSDGLASPARIAREIARSDLKFTSLTDHNTVGGLPELHAHLQGSGVVMVNGVELSSSLPETGQLHVLGYGIDGDCQPLRQAMKRILGWKREQLRRILRTLREQNVAVQEEELLSGEAQRYVGRLDLARLLVQKGYTRSTGQAFARYLGREGSAYYPARTFEPAECIRLIHAAGGLAVLAHPTPAELDACVEKLAAAGLDGIEAYRPGAAGHAELYAEEVAKSLGLLVTGGSDWHGRASDPPLGAFRVTGRKLAGFLARLNQC
jgi:predicted metal-dependent phosphoesterase TrpH